MNPRKLEHLQEMLTQINNMIRQASDAERQQAKRLKKIHPKYRQSARNLIHYRVLRKEDVRSLQKRLGNMGLSRLAKGSRSCYGQFKDKSDHLKSFSDPFSA